MVRARGRSGCESKSKRPDRRVMGGRSVSKEEKRKTEGMREQKMLWGGKIKLFINPTLIYLTSRTS